MEQKTNRENTLIPSEEKIYECLCRRHTKEVQDKLMEGKVAIAGLGGLGSTIAVLLARAGVKNLHLIDFDRVELSNLNRQQYRMADVGRYKAEALKEIVLEINPYLVIRTDILVLDPINTQTIFKDDQIVCEAFDDPEQKAMLVDAFFTAYKEDKKLIAGSGMAGFFSSNTIRTKKLGDRFYLCGDEENGIQQGCGLMAPRVAICAAHQANMVIRLLVNEEEP